MLWVPVGAKDRRQGYYSLWINECLLLINVARYLLFSTKKSLLSKPLPRVTYTRTKVGQCVLLDKARGEAETIGKEARTDSAGLDQGSVILKPPTEC
jgi:hypothetical protein